MTQASRWSIWHWVGLAALGQWGLFGLFIGLQVVGLSQLAWTWGLLILLAPTLVLVPLALLIWLIFPASEGAHSD